MGHIWAHIQPTHKEAANLTKKKIDQEKVEEVEAKEFELHHNNQNLKLQFSQLFLDQIEFFFYKTDC